MSTLFTIGISLYVLFFFISVIFSLKFQFGREGKDERGNKILYVSYGIAFPLILIGWLFITLLGEFLITYSLESFQKAIWFLVTGTFIIHAGTMFSLKRISEPCWT